MLNEEKIGLMTKAASYEAHEGKKTIPVNKYFYKDYVSLNLIKAGVSFTIAYALCVGLWVFYHVDDLMNNIHKMDLAGFGRNIFFIYICLLIVYLGISYFFYSSKYSRNRKSLSRYYQILKKISQIYDTESRTGNTDVTGGVDENDDFAGN